LCDGSRASAIKLSALVVASTNLLSWCYQLAELTAHWAISRAALIVLITSLLLAELVNEAEHVQSNRLAIPKLCLSITFRLSRVSKCKNKNSGNFIAEPRERLGEDTCVIYGRVYQSIEPNSSLSAASSPPSSSANAFWAARLALNVKYWRTTSWQASSQQNFLVLGWWIRWKDFSPSSASVISDEWSFPVFNFFLLFALLCLFVCTFCLQIALKHAHCLHSEFPFLSSLVFWMVVLWNSLNASNTKVEWIYLIFRRSTRFPQVKLEQRTSTASSTQTISGWS
jgi:hypothetical protein